MAPAIGGMDAKPKLLDQVRSKLRAGHYSYRTEQQYLAWIRRFILHYDKRHPRELSGPEVEGFLTHLAVDRGVSASTQNQALSRILFLYRKVLGIDLPWLGNVVRARRATKLPTVLTQNEVSKLLSNLEGDFGLIAQLLYGSGLRLMEALRLRVKNIDFEYAQILVRNGKGNKDRMSVLPRRSAKHRPGADGACGRPDYADLHARNEEGSEWSQEPVGLGMAIGDTSAPGTGAA